MINVLHLGLSYACNLRCRHCFVNKSRDKLSLNQIKNMIKILHGQGLFSIFYTYGEPLLYKNFEELVKYVKSLGIVQILMTNGLLVNSKNAPIISQYIDTVYVSLDSSKDFEHDENRGYSGAFYKALEGVDILINKGVNVGFSVTVTPKNCNQLKDIIALAKKLNVKLISFLRERQLGKLVILDQSCQYFQIYNEFLEGKYSDMNLLFHDIELQKLLNKKKKNFCEIEFERLVSMNLCHVDNTISIAPNGDVYRCNLCGNSLGNVTMEEFESIIQKEFCYENNVCFTKLSQKG